MKTSIPSNVFARGTDLDANMKRISEANFEAVDYSLTHNSISWDVGFFADPSSPAFKEYFENIARAVATQGLELYMTHAPYCRPFEYEAEAYAKIQKHTIRAVYATAYMKCPHIVVHPVMHPDFSHGQRREQAIQANLDYFGALVPALKETGVVMCIENVYSGIIGERKISNACSDADQLIEVIDTLNKTYGPYFAACLDTGHAVASGHDPVEMLRMLGHRTRALHLHETWGLLDDHLFPATAGNIDWDDFCKMLAKIDYQGTFNFEVIIYPRNKFTVESSYDAYCDATMRMLSDVAHSMVKVAEDAR